MSAPTSAIQSVLVENRVFSPSAATVKAARVSGMKQYQAMCDTFERDFEGTWARLARENLIWNKPFNRVLNQSNKPFYKWFEDGELNASANCLDKHIGTSTEHKTAIRFESDDGQVPWSATRSYWPGSASLPMRSRPRGSAREIGC